MGVATRHLWRGVLGLVLAGGLILAARTGASGSMPQSGQTWQIFLPRVFSRPLPSATPAPPAWTMFLHDPQHTGRSAYTGPSSPKLYWQAEGGSFLAATPLIGANSTVYANTLAQSVVAIDGATGATIQTYPTAGVGWGIGALGSDGSFYSGESDPKCSRTCNGYVTAINQDGSVKWTYDSGRPEGYGPPTIGPDGTIYIGSGGTGDSLSGYVYAFTPNGNMKWKYHTGGSARSAPALGADGSIYVVGILTVYGINPDGTKKWSFNLNTGGSSAAIGPDGTIYFGAQSEIVAVNPDGSQKWTYPTTGSCIVSSSPITGVDGTVYAEGDDGYLYALGTDGSLRWRAGSEVNNCPDGPPGSLTSDVNGTIYAAMAPGIVAYNSDGTTKWKYSLDATPTSPPSISTDGTLYVGTKNGYVYALGD